jgi:hypothetical protein
LKETNRADRRRQHQGRGGGVRAAQQQHDQRRDQRQIEDERRERRERKGASGIEQTHQYGDRADESEIRQHQPCRSGCKLKPLILEARRNQRHNRRRGKRQHDSRGQRRQTDGAEHAPGERCCGAGAITLAHREPRRHQRGIERAFRQQPPHHVDELKRGQKGIGDRAGAEQRRGQHVAGKASETRQRGTGRHGQDMAEHRGASGPVLAGGRRIV